MSNTGADSRDRIMEATYRALIETGFANLTMSDIARESETSTGLLHYHFDTKEDLLVAFLEHLLDQMKADLAADEAFDPVERLARLLGWFVLETDESERHAFHVALLELRSQAPYNERYRRRLREADAILRSAFADIIRDGIEAEVFEDDDPEVTAGLLVAAMDGARNRQLMVGQAGYADAVLGAIRRYVFEELFTDTAATRWDQLAIEAGHQ